MRCHKEEYRQNTAVEIIEPKNNVSAIIATLKSVSFFILSEQYIIIIIIK